MTDRRKAYGLVGAALSVLLAVGTGVYYYNNNMAKALISQHDWNAQQTVDIWNQEDCCGGA